MKHQCYKTIEKKTNLKYIIIEKVVLNVLKRLCLCKKNYKNTPIGLDLQIYRRFF